MTFSSSPGIGEPGEKTESHLLALKPVPKAPGVETKNLNVSPVSRSPSSLAQSPKSHRSDLPSVFAGGDFRALQCSLKHLSLLDSHLSGTSRL